MTKTLELHEVGVLGYGIFSSCHTGAKHGPCSLSYGSSSYAGCELLSDCRRKRLARMTALEKSISGLVELGSCIQRVRLRF